MSRLLATLFFILSGFILSGFWGFFAHKEINRLAVFSLPPEMIAFYKANLDYLREGSVNPDRKRLVVANEAQRHYIDLDHFGDSAAYTMPRFWKEACAKYTEDTLQAYGIVPWHINAIFYQLKDAFVIKDPKLILKLSADIGHYIADAHVPLHTTKNYNGQLTNQHGIHGFWESRLPELFFDEYNFWIGKAAYVQSPQLAVWKAIVAAHTQVDTLLTLEKDLTRQFGDKKFSFEMRGKQTVKVYSKEFSVAYHKALQGTIEKQLRASVKMIADFWYTAWVDAGQPDLKALLYYKPTEAELELRRAELKLWKEEQRLPVREHEGENR